RRIVLTTRKSLRPRANRFRTAAAKCAASRAGFNLRGTSVPLCGSCIGRMNEMGIRRTCLLLAFCAGVTSASDDLSWLDVYLAQPILQPRQTMIEAQIHLASRVKAIPPISEKARWDQYVRQLRAQILENVVFRGEAAAWRDAPTRVEWSNTLA